MTSDEANDHFKRTTAGGKWRMLKGVHALRHSYISALEAKGVDQRIIDVVIGHEKPRAPPRNVRARPPPTHAFPSSAKPSVARRGR